jgi:hypothetical protein
MEDVGLVGSDGGGATADVANGDGAQVKSSQVKPSQDNGRGERRRRSSQAKSGQVKPSQDKGCGERRRRSRCGEESCQVKGRGQGWYLGATKETTSSVRLSSDVLAPPACQLPNTAGWRVMFTSWCVKPSQCQAKSSQAKPSQATPSHPTHHKCNGPLHRCSCSYQVTSMHAMSSHGMPSHVVSSHVMSMSSQAEASDAPQVVHHTFMSSQVISSHAMSMSSQVESSQVESSQVKSSDAPQVVHYLCDAKPHDGGTR